MCLDWRALNKQTVRNGTVTPDIQTLPAEIGQHKVCSVLDCMSACHQIRLSEEDNPRRHFAPI